MFGRNKRGNEGGNDDRDQHHKPWRRWDESDRGTSSQAFDRFFGADEHRSANHENDDYTRGSRDHRFFEDRPRNTPDRVYEDRGYNDNEQDLSPQSIRDRANQGGDRRSMGTSDYNRPVKYNYGQGNYERNFSQPQQQQQRTNAPYGNRSTNYEYQRNEPPVRRSGMAADFQSEGVYQIPEGMGRGFSEFQNPSSHFGKGPKGYKRSDERIHEDVCEALYHDPHVDASDIEVKVDSGTVILTGTVDSRQAKRAAEECVEHLQGVHDVRNEISVKKADWTAGFSTKKDASDKLQ